MGYARPGSSPGFGTKKKTMSQKVKQPDRNFRIDWQGYNTDDPKKREERVDVSPAGTEGIFIDVESPEYDEEQE